MDAINSQATLHPAQGGSTLNTCRACLAPDPYLFLPLGDHSPAQMLIRPEDLNREQPSFPLNPQVCLACGLIQIADQIPADFFRHYLYVPSGASTLHSHFHELAEVLTTRVAGGLIVEIGRTHRHADTLGLQLILVTKTVLIFFHLVHWIRLLGRAASGASGNCAQWLAVELRRRRNVTAAPQKPGFSPNLR